MSGAKRTVDPAAITTLEEWSRAYRKYANIVLDNGVPAVLSRTDTSVVKRIPWTKGTDLYVGLTEGTEAAVDAMEETRSVLQAAVSEAAPGMREAERQLLDATDAWRLAKTAIARHAAALHVGRLSVALRDAAHILRSAEMPVRFTRIIDEITIRDLNYHTGDDRAAPNLTQFRSHQVPIEMRTITATDRA